MSMLTPPGMGGKYRITGNRYPRMVQPKRRGRKVLAVFGTLVVLAGLGFGTLQLTGILGFGDSGKPAEAGERDGNGSPGNTSCPAGQDDAKPAAPPEPETITVNVYNATTRSGLAQSTADALAERGFVIGVVDNAPADLDGKVRAAGLLVGSAQAEDKGVLAVLGAHLAEPETRVGEPLVPPSATGEPAAGEPAAGDGPLAVDLVLGNAFEELAPPAQADAVITALAAEAEKAATGC
ncbi:LytR C-terminal domain-containing protein [Streptomyces sp. YIM 98790]|uniref:LytR C-terminal domain-containing protein n=1 Tax=Streptomyces sp. YIM 98790 TaxID=2689077 RepID=UPI0014077334|nr:LytR C-terminal domain-containing protein [Streptomyces sp. YIM 98790]